MTYTPQDIVRELFTGLLGREPDAEALAFYVRRLADNPIAQVVREISWSDEFAARHGKELLEHGTGDWAFIEVSLGLWAARTLRGRKYISVGTTCLTAAVLSRLGLRDAAYPLDWLFSSFPMAAACLEDDFETLLDMRHYEPTPEAERIDAVSMKGAHRLYRERFGVGYVFNHHELPEKLGYFQRAAARFLRATGEPNVFVAMGPEADFGPAVYEIARRLPKLLVVLINEDGPRSFAFEEIERSDRLVICRFRAGSILDGVLFKDPLDTDILALETIRALQTM